jgi:hypothetical protein
MRPKRFNSAIVALILTATPLPTLLAGTNIVAGDYEIHEWGVLAGCKADTNYFSTSRPMKVYTIREPIIYVHSKDRQSFSLKVTFSNGVPTDTYPPAAVSNNTVSWQNVRIAEEKALVARTIPRETFVPLKDIMGILSDADSDLISCEGQTSKFLFYEGEIPFVNKVVARMNPTNKTIVVSNFGAFAVYDVMLIQPGPQSGPLSFMRQLFMIHVNRLDANQSVEATPAPLTNQFSFASQLVNLGFTEKEAASFNNLWHQPFLQMGNILYRLSEEECDQLTSLAFEPKPRKSLRALYVVVRP